MGRGVVVGEEVTRGRGEEVGRGGGVVGWRVEAGWSVGSGVSVGGARVSVTGTASRWVRSHSRPPAGMRSNKMTTQPARSQILRGAAGGATPSLSGAAHCGQRSQSGWTGLPQWEQAAAGGMMASPVTGQKRAFWGCCWPQWGQGVVVMEGLFVLFLLVCYDGEVYLRCSDISGTAVGAKNAKEQPRSFRKLRMVKRARAGQALQFAGCQGEGPDFVAPAGKVDGHQDLRAVGGP